MAHAFQIMDDTGTLTTYTDYDSIPLSTLKHVISFIPVLGTLVTSNEIVFESSLQETIFDINTTLILDNELDILKYLYGATSSTGADLLFKNSSGTTLKTTRQSSSGGDSILIESGGTDGSGTNAGDEILLDRTDAGGSNAGSKLIQQSADEVDFGIRNSSGAAIITFTFSSVEISSGIIYTQSVDLGFRDKLAREDFDSDLENHLLLETADDDIVDNHYHETTERAHYDGDGHTEDEHRDIALWNYRLQLLVTQEKTNASSN